MVKSNVEAKEESPIEVRRCHRSPQWHHCQQATGVGGGQRSRKRSFCCNQLGQRARHTKNLPSIQLKDDVHIDVNKRMAMGRDVWDSRTRRVGHRESPSHKRSEN
jgi:hypothetical protein